MKVIRVICVFILMWTCGDIVVSEETEGYDEILVSNIFVETDLRQALQDISAQTGVSIIPDSYVQGLVSVQFDEVPLEKCLEMLLVPLGFTFKQIDDYYIATSTDPRSPSFHLISRTERVHLRHVKAVDAVYNLPSFLLSYIKINQDKNILTITAPDGIIERIKKDIGVVDVPPKQLSISVVVTEISRDDIEEMGLDWSDDMSVNLSGEYIFGETSSYQLVGELAKRALLSVKMMAREGKVSIRANPRILATDTEEASIDIGTDKYVVLETGSVDSTYARLQSVSAGIKLKIVPFIGAENDITLEVETEVSDIQPGTAEDVKLSVSRRSANTTIHIEDGQTVGIGGLVQQNREERSSGVPVMRDMPVLGSLFGTKNYVDTDSELIIFITPHIIDTTASAESVAELPPFPSVTEPEPDVDSTKAPLGVKTLVEAGMDDAALGMASLSIHPRLSYEILGSGLEVSASWRIPVPVIEDDIALAIYESYAYQLPSIPIVIYAENYNIFPLGAGDIEGAATLGIRFIELMMLEITYSYLPLSQLSGTLGVGHTFDVGRGLFIEIYGITRIDLLENPGLHNATIANDYSFESGGFSISVGVAAELEFTDPAPVVFRVSPRASVGFAF